MLRPQAARCVMRAREAFVIVGGGQAGAWAAKTLRQEGFDGRITVVGSEEHPPYERPPLSKQLLLGESDIEAAYVFPMKSYVEWDVELRLATTVARLVPNQSRIEFSNGGSLAYDRLLLATGGRPRKLTLPGSSSGNVFYLRSANDALALRRTLCTPGRALIIGGGWIGLEVAAAARKLGAEVTLVESANRLCSRAAPQEISDFLLDLHRGHGVDVRLNTTVTTFEGNGRIGRIQLSDGEALDVSAVVVGIGIAPATELAAEAGVMLDNGIVVDERLQTSISGIFAAGDVANFRSGFGQRIRLESWDNAQKQGIAAGQGMLGKPAKIDRYPWFWSDQYDQNIQLVGSVSEHSDSIALPAASSHSRVLLYRRDGQITGAVGINAGRDIRLMKRRLEAGQAIDIPAASQPDHLFQERLKR